jgi:molybdate transport system substrate-binding protein
MNIVFRLMVVSLTVCILCGGCFDSKKPMLFHAGVGQRSSLLDIKAVFEKENPGVEVNYSFKGSGYFLPDLERSKKGDLFLPGEEFYLLQAQERGHVKSYDPVKDLAAYFMVVIATPRGNPANIKGLKDFARKGVRVGLGNPKACAIGLWDEKTFKKAGIWDEVQANSVQSAKCIAEKLTSVQNRIVDCTLIWSSTAVLALRDIEIIPIEPECRGFVRLPVAVLKHSVDFELAEKLKALILSKRGSDIFQSHAYVTNPGPIDKEGFCLDGGKASEADCRFLLNAAAAVKDDSLPIGKDSIGMLENEVLRQRKTIHPGAF